MDNSKIICMFLLLFCLILAPAPAANAQYSECPEPGPCCFSYCGGGPGSGVQYCIYYIDHNGYYTIECPQG